MPKLSVAYLGFQPCKVHESLDLIRSTLFAIFPKIFMDLPIPIDIPRLRLKLLNQPSQAIIVFLAPGLGLLQPGVISTGMGVEQITKLADRPYFAMTLEKGVPHSGWLTMYAAAF
jgi:hypothetical protein